LGGTIFQLTRAKDAEARGVPLTEGVGVEDIPEERSYFNMYDFRRRKRNARGEWEHVEERLTGAQLNYNANDVMTPARIFWLKVLSAIYTNPRWHGHLDKETIQKCMQEEQVKFNPYGHLGVNERTFMIGPWLTEVRPLRWGPYLGIDQSQMPNPEQARFGTQEFYRQFEADEALSPWEARQGVRMTAMTNEPFDFESARHAALRQGPSRAEREATARQKLRGLMAELGLLAPRKRQQWRGPEDKELERLQAECDRFDSEREESDDEIPYITVPPRGTPILGDWEDDIEPLPAAPADFETGPLPEDKFWRFTFGPNHEKLSDAEKIEMIRAARKEEVLILNKKLNNWRHGNRGAVKDPFSTRYCRYCGEQAHFSLTNPEQR
jgi:hypothetical protein